MATIITLQASDQITNSRADINTSLANLNSDKIETSVIDTDTTLAANSDAKIPSQKAVKAYVDAGGNVNASTTNKGIVEAATSTEITNGTATGGTGAVLAVTPDALKSSQVPIIRTYVNSGSPHTWTKPTGLKYVVVELVGSGGAGGGTNNNNVGAAGGGGGGYSRKVIPVASLGATETVTVPAGGTGVSDAAGNAGGTTSFGTHCTATGGGGGGAEAGGQGGSGGAGSGGDLNIDGDTGSSGSTPGGSGKGGSTLLGGGGRPPATSGNNAGNAGGNYGGGGSGGQKVGAGADASGGAGKSGIVVITELYN